MQVNYLTGVMGNRSPEGQYDAGTDTGSQSLLDVLHTTFERGVGYEGWTR
jgi:hypothetical protein